MNWGIEDFVAAAVLLIGAAFALVLIFKVARSRLVRLALACGVLLVVLVIWAHLAVGIF